MGLHPPPSPGWAVFSIMMEYTPESGHCHSVMHSVEFPVKWNQGTRQLVLSWDPRIQHLLSRIFRIWNRSKICLRLFFLKYILYYRNRTEPDSPDSGQETARSQAGMQEGLFKELFLKIQSLKGSSGQIRSAREWYQWISQSKDIPSYSFCFFILILTVFKILTRLLPKSIKLPMAWEVGKHLCSLNSNPNCINNKTNSWFC